MRRVPARSGARPHGAPPRKPPKGAPPAPRGAPSAQVAALAQRHGVPFHLGKPFGADELLAVVARAHAA